MSTPPKLPIPNMDLVNPSNLPPSLNNTDSSMSIPAIPGAPGQSSETAEQNKIRFQVELEFVQCFGNPNYLNFIAQRGYLKDKDFINYLKYLKYWKKTEYAEYIKYPQCLHHLDLLQYPSFRQEVANQQCTKFIDDQQLLQWQHYQRRRVKLINKEHERVEKHRLKNLPETNDTS